MMVSESAIDTVLHRRPPERRRLLPRAPPRHLPGDQGARRAAGARRLADRHRAAHPDRRARRGGRRGRRRALASTTPAPANARHYATIVRENALLRRLLDTAQAHRGAPSTSARASRASWSSSAESLLFKVAHEEQAEDFHELAADPRGRGRRASRRSRSPAAAITGTAVRLRRPRRDHRRLPARQPDHHRRPPGHGQVRPRRQHRRERRRRRTTGRSPSSRSRCRRWSWPSA